MSLSSKIPRDIGHSCRGGQHKVLLIVRGFASSPSCGSGGLSLVQHAEDRADMDAPNFSGGPIYCRSARAVMRTAVDSAVKLSEQSFPCRNLAIAWRAIARTVRSVPNRAPTHLQIFKWEKINRERHTNPLLRSLHASIIINQAIGDRAREQPHTVQQTRSFSATRTKSEGRNETPYCPAGRSAVGVLGACTSIGLPAHI
jgi:hypothetical protein